MKPQNHLGRLLHFLCFLLIIAIQGSEAPANARDLDYYHLESIPLPEGESSVDAVAFLPDGRLVCALSLSKIFTYNPATKEWRVFVEGLHTPLGLWPLNDREILVSQRPEITLISDQNGDGKADHFKTISDKFGLSGNYAEFSFGPVADSKGNLFFGLGTGSAFGNLLTDEVRGLYSRAGHDGRMNSSVPYRGWIMKITPEGETLPWASGFREPNGLGFDLEGNLFAPDNQGDFVGSSKVYHIQEGGFYGHPHSEVWRATNQRHPFDIPIPELDRKRTRGAIVLPHGEMANSPSQPLCDTTQGRFGPFAGQMFIGEMNFTRLIRLMLEKVDGEFQGACVPFMDNTGLNLGNNRLAFSPRDGSLWIGQTKHQAWVGASGLQHLTWKGITPMEVQTMRLTEDGFALTFTRPVETKSASNPGTYDLQSYFYNYHEQYGSSKYELSSEPVTAVHISADQRTVSLTLNSMKPWRIYDLKIAPLKSKDGHPLLNNWMVYTLNRLLTNTPQPQPPIPTRTPRRTQPMVTVSEIKSVGSPQTFPATSKPSGVKIRRIDGDYQFSENDNAILLYRKNPVSLPDGSHKRGHYIHPLYDLDGVLMTHDMPTDHPHHRGVFWAWTQLWIGNKRIGHPWEQRGLSWDVQEIQITGDDSSTALEAEVLWNSPFWTDAQGKPKAIVEERALIRVHEATANERIIDFRIALRALEKNVRIGGSTDAKGYGGFSVRIPLPSDLEIIGSREAVSVNLRRPSKPQPWVDFTADFGQTGEKTGLAILCHPSLPGFPQGWTIRRSNSCQNPVFPGRDPIELPTDAPLILRYRIIIHKGDTETAQIAQRFQDYSIVK